MPEGQPISASLPGGYTLTYNNLPANPSFSITVPEGIRQLSANNIDPNDILGGQYDLTPVAGTTTIGFNNGGQVIVPDSQLSTFAAALAQTAQSLINQSNAQATTVPDSSPVATGDPAVTALSDVPSNVTPVDDSALNANLPNVSVPVGDTQLTPKTPSTEEILAGVPPVQVPTGDLQNAPKTPEGQTGPLPLGKDIQDIYDPNLTSEQVASLNPGDQAARAAYLKDNAPYTGPKEQIVVTAAKGLTGAKQEAITSATSQDQSNAAAKAGDWRVRLVLAPSANYLYKATSPGILQPLKESDGVIFPYTPQIQVNYAANYESMQLTHTNYKVFQYQSSGVDNIQITCDFTAQDVNEANYILAVIHFFRSMTKMFYGQDSYPKNGTPPPLCYIYGLGGYQFDNLPLAISGFNYSLPNDVDYIKTTGASPAGTTQPEIDPIDPSNAAQTRLQGTAATQGGKAIKKPFTSTQQSASVPPTWVPSKITLSVSCVPIISRDNISNKFSLTDYATGNLLLGSSNGKGGFW